MNAWLAGWRSLRRMGWPLNMAILLLLAIGILFVFSACFVREEAGADLYRKQIVWILAGLAVHLFLAGYDYRRLERLSPWLYAVSLLLLVMVLFLGTKLYGARRWLKFLGISIQPSEFAKMATVLLLAGIMSRPGLHARAPRILLATLATIAVPAWLIFKEPDLGTAMLLVPVAFIMLFVAGVSMKWLGGLAAIGGSAALLVLAVMVVPPKLGLDDQDQQKLMKALGLRGYHLERVMVFFQPGKDPLGAGWNKMQSEIAVGSGGTWGKGFRRGTQNILGFLPVSVAPTDFIYSVIAEEVGFAGSAVVIFLYGVVVVVGLRTGLAATDKFGRLLCAGFTTLLFCHVFVNIAMTVGIMPITGLPLPLVSYGGSFMMVTMSILGIIQSVHIRSRQPWQSEG